MKTINLKLTAILLITICFFSTKAQNSVLFYTGVNEIEVYYPNLLKTFQDSKTYVVMNDPESEKMQPYIDVFKKYWTISKITFIKKSEIENYYADGNIFITVDSRKIVESSTHHNSSGEISNTNTFTRNDIRISFWSFSENGYQEMQKEMKKKKPMGKNELDEMYQLVLARILLFPDFDTYFTDKSLDFDFDGDGRFRNCGPGFLKNQILYIISLLEQNKELVRGQDQWKDYFMTCLPYYNFKELAKLKTSTLYTTEKTLYSVGKFMTTTESTQSEVKLFKNYKYDYKILSTEELNQKILTDSTEFFYLMYGANRGGRKYVWIVNSLTGEVIYSFYDEKMSRYMKPNNLKDINDKITKGK